MQRSNLYVILFSLILTITLGGILALASEGLAPLKQKQIALDIKKQILSAVMEVTPNDDVLSIYHERIKPLVVDIEGNFVEKDEEGDSITVENISVRRQYKLPAEKRYYPVYEFVSKTNSQDVEAYILPVFGVGLWDYIWAYVAVANDLNTIKGIAFDHEKETPGLGARITDKEIQRRYIGKKLYNDIGKLVSVTMVKGETRNPHQYDKHHVDGMSGATKTAEGVNDMLFNYTRYYQKYFDKLKAKRPSLK
ncbi:MAG: NADH:ubiquinone reductase (Na(+)-transporting) subunit C [Cytophagales bacterium]|nr:NADH:ubiquinone reductase (Na(+)-transporting) subunit C [Cytophagales bacterium]